MSVMANKGAACGCCSPQVRSVRAFDQKHFEINRISHTQATSTGARVFGAMKGASDGGIFYPALRAAFPGVSPRRLRLLLHLQRHCADPSRTLYSFDPESKELDAETLQSYIYGAHVSEFMESLEVRRDFCHLPSNNSAD